MEKDPTIKEKLKQQAYEIWQDPEMREHLSKKRKEMWQDPSFIENQKAKMKERWEDPQQHENASKAMKKVWKDIGYLEGLLLSYPTRQQAINYLTNFIGNKIQSEGKSRQIYMTYNKYLNIINNHTFPNEVQQNIPV